MYKRLTKRYEDKYVVDPLIYIEPNSILSKVTNRLAELEDRLENGTLVELGKPYIRQLNRIPQQDKYIICKAQEVGITGVLTKAEAEAKLRELKEQQNE